MITYDLLDKPNFKYGDKVKVKLPGFNLISYGTIVGLGSKHVIDLWLVDFGSPISDSYPYSVCSIPHVMIIKEKNT